MKFRAALLTKINSPLEIAEVEARPLLPGQVFVKVLASGICGAQLQEIRGEKGKHFPRFMGHEGVGIVEQVWDGCEKLKVGDKVCMHWRKGSGRDSESPKYIVDGREFTSGQVTTFSEYSVCSENRLTKVPHDTPNELISLLGCALSTALGVIENDAKLEPGQSILIFGCGGVGLNLIRVAKMFGAEHIAVLDHSNEKAMLAHRAGADAYGITLPEYDVVVDTTGEPGLISYGAMHMAPSGRLIMVGQPKEGEYIHINNARHLFEGEGKTIKASQGGSFFPDHDLPRYISLYNRGKLDFDGIVTHQFPFEQINLALDTVRSGEAGRVLLNMV